MRQLLTSRDFLSGLMFMAVGAIALAGVREDYFGSARDMGPAFFPTLVAWLLIGLGVAITGRAVVERGEALGGPVLRPFLAVAGIVAFALLIEDAGFVIATAALVLAACLAGERFRPVEAALLFAGLTVAAALIFVYGLEVSMHLWPGG